MENQEPTSTEAMRQLKEAKFALNAGSPRQALTFAKNVFEIARSQEIPRIEAFALHRIGSAEEALGRANSAEVSMRHAHAILDYLPKPDYLAQGIVERDIALLLASKNKSTKRHTEAHDWHKQAVESHQMAHELQAHKESRVQLELATTASFAHRLTLSENRHHRGSINALWQDVKDIRHLRRHTKPGYELDAIEWATRYERDPITIAKHLPRVAFLGLQVGNPITPASLAIRPVTRLASNRLD